MTVIKFFKCNELYIRKQKQNYQCLDMALILKTASYHLYWNSFLNLVSISKFRDYFEAVVLNLSRRQMGCLTIVLANIFLIIHLPFYLIIVNIINQTFYIYSAILEFSCQNLFQEPKLSYTYSYAKTMLSLMFLDCTLSTCSIRKCNCLE